MKLVVTLLLALLFLAVESVVVKYVGFTIARVDVTVAIVAVLALRAGLLEGAAGAFGTGYLLDLMTGRPTGLYTFLAVLTFLLCRAVGSALEVRSAPGFALFAMGADAVHGLLAVLITLLTAKQGGFLNLSLTGIPLEVVLTGAAALVLYPLLRKFGPGPERPAMGLLR